MQDGYQPLHEAARRHGRKGQNTDAAMRALVEAGADLHDIPKVRGGKATFFFSSSFNLRC